MILLRTTEVLNYKEFSYQKDKSCVLFTVADALFILYCTTICISSKQW